jgi:hypothetical protein
MSATFSFGSGGLAVVLPWSDFPSDFPAPVPRSRHLLCPRGRSEDGALANPLSGLDIRWEVALCPIWLGRAWSMRLSAAHGSRRYPIRPTTYQKSRTSRDELNGVMFGPSSTPLFPPCSVSALNNNQVLRAGRSSLFIFAQNPDPHAVMGGLQHMMDATRP